MDNAGRGYEHRTYQIASEENERPAEKTRRSRSGEARAWEGRGEVTEKSEGKVENTA